MGRRPENLYFLVVRRVDGSVEMGVKVGERVKERGTKW